MNKEKNLKRSNFDVFADEICYSYKHLDSGLVVIMTEIYAREIGQEELYKVIGYRKYDFKEVLAWFSREYKEPIKVAKLWYDILDYLFKKEDRHNLTGKVSDYFMNRFIKYIPKEYQNIPMQEYLERLGVEE